MWLDEVEVSRVRLAGHLPELNLGKRPVLRDPTVDVFVPGADSRPAPGNLGSAVINPLVVTVMHILLDVERPPFFH